MLGENSAAQEDIMQHRAELIRGWGDGRSSSAWLYRGNPYGAPQGSNGNGP